MLKRIGTRRTQSKFESFCPESLLLYRQESFLPVDGEQAVASSIFHGCQCIDWFNLVTYRLLVEHEEKDNEAKKPD